MFLFDIFPNYATASAANSERFIRHRSVNRLIFFCRWVKKPTKKFIEKHKRQVDAIIKESKLKMNKIKRSLERAQHQYEIVSFLTRNPTRATIFFATFISLSVFAFGKIYEIESHYGLLIHLYLIPIHLGLAAMLFTLVATLLSFENDEPIRIDESDENSRIDINKNCIYFGIPFSRVHLSFLDGDFFELGKDVSILLNWMNFERDSYYRLNFGALDIPKVRLRELKYSSNEVRLVCASTSFFDIAFTHYFPDFPLSNSSTSANGPSPTLRRLLQCDLEQHYSKIAEDGSELELYPH